MNKQLSTVQNSDREKCTCKEQYYECHSCPFKSDVNNDSTSSCNCCPYCTRQCAEDI